MGTYAAVVTSYRPRVADAELHYLMDFMGAVLIEGATASGMAAASSPGAATTRQQSRRVSAAAPYCP